MTDDRGIGRLQHDLADGGRDAAYRAMSFVAREGGPGIAMTSDDGDDMPRRREMLGWLAGHPAPAGLAESYEQYCRDWSPIFQD